ncbi:MAG: hypothetical protein COV43_04065 [Deltaproteobacteria bacterium CG11_big_fil_rev_8_21_14_0_20_42_23]|nr:MAG: hypothetical protein COV43_04065 [Deltaproteobacteria bacterium CG11_big_fil_rev_8_21_14_0_20_42_23]PJC64895.1 MAG: hypothetical protein CO021_01950 [Deltaproteobacteria bacterium CG_4_9_14_0_2_um_filter_42_21]
MKKILRLFAFLLCLGGITLSGLSLSHHQKIKHAGFEGDSFCNINQTINCDIADASSYSELFSTPVAWWALSFYLFILILLGIDFVSESAGKASRAFALMLTFLSLFAAVYFSFVLYSVLQVVCILCLGMHLINLVLFILFFVDSKVTLLGFPKYLLRYLQSAFKTDVLPFQTKLPAFTLSFFFFFFFSGIVAKAVLSAPNESPIAKASMAEKVSAHYVGSLYEIELNKDWPVWGNPDAKVVLIEFSDFQCPFCKRAALNIKPYLQEFKDKVQLRFVNYPLDMSCNSKLDHPLHAHACMAAKASICASKKMDFWKFHDDIFNHQKGLNDETLQKIARDHGIDEAFFNTCLSSPETEARLQEDLAAAHKIYISGTPTILLNGRAVRYWTDGRFLQALVQEELKRVK